MENPYLMPSMDLLTSAVLYGSSRDVDTVIVDGRILKRDGVLTSLDLREALASAQERVQQIIGRFFREHPEQMAAWQRRVHYMG